jgi:hypothetical protein
MDTTKAFLRGKFTAMSTYIKNTGRAQINNLILHLKLLKNNKKLNLKEAGEK